ncbi:MAG: hypothetical protein ACOH19_01670 [Rhodoglobus sp.]
MTRTEVSGTEELLLARNPRAAAAYAAAAEAGRAAVVDLYKQHVDLYKRYGAEPDDASLGRIDTELESIIARTLAEYGRTASGLFSAEDLALWTAKISRVTGSYVARATAVGVPGALLLLDSMEDAELAEDGAFVSLDDTLSNGAEYCQCGYASTRVVPGKLCFLCSQAVLNEWKAEERRLLARAPGADADLAGVIDGLLDGLANVYFSGGASSGVESAIRRAGDAGIARVNEARDGEIALLDRTWWNELAVLNGLSSIELIRTHRKYWARWGLGSAQATGLAIRSSPDLEKRMRLIAGARPAPKQGFFERLFSRR